MSTAHKDTEPALDDEQRRMNDAMARAVRRALLRHKQAGNPIAAWRHGKVVWIPPEKILAEESLEPTANE
jgi:hypothetical protein